MSEFKAKTDKPLKFDIQEIWNENSCLIEDDVFSLSMVAGKSILGRADFTRAITPLLTAYTTTRAELETVKAELDRGNWISTNQPPKIGERVLLLVECIGESYVAIGKLKEDNLYYKDKGTLSRPMEIITHWQPLPTL